MSQSQRDVIIERVKKLMAYSTQAGIAHPDEIENALKLARQLMDKYAIEEEAVLVEDEAARQRAYTEVMEATAHEQKRSSISHPEKYLGWVCCYVCDVKMYNSTNKFWDSAAHRMVGGQKLVFYGMPKDVAVAVALYREVRVTMRAMAKLTFPDSSSKQFDFFKGFSTRLVDRARDMKRASSQPQAAAGAIILAKDAILERYGKEKLNLVPARRTRQSTTDWGAYCAGRTVADNVDLGTNGIEGRDAQTKYLQ